MESNVDELRANAAVQELNAVIQGLIQRCVNLSADLAEANARVAALEETNKQMVEANAKRSAAALSSEGNHARR